MIAGINDLATLEPLLVKQWSKKNKIKPTEVSIGSLPHRFKKEFLWGRGRALSLRMISVIYTQQVQKGRCEKTQSSFFTSPFFEKNKLKMRTYGIIRNDLAVIAFLINAACIVMYEQVQENANVEIYARMAYMDTMTGLGNRTASVTESAVMSS